MTAAAALSVAPGLPEAIDAAVAALTPDGPRPACSLWMASRPGRPWSLNRERSLTRWEHRRETDEARKEWGALWMVARVPRLSGPVAIVARPWMRTGVLQDPGNCYPALKPAVDALVDRRVIPDDNGTWVHLIALLPAFRGDDGLSVAVVPLASPETL